MKKLIAFTLTCSLVAASIPSAQAQVGFGSIMGGAVGAALGGTRGGGGAVAGAIIGVAMGTILEQLTAQEKNQRQQALQQAARGKSASWSTHGKSGKKARYVNKGAVASADGKRCSKVEETIQLPDGKQGKSVETVCFS
ncbi:hypothetical protein SLNSH_01710 [Alsobacter soli]|uniref:Glycine zipper domain-containing protein n=1 Tax=Alsobacter soli TaxID=2109933 RepID=A0A2T1HY63_9HYPH|nr:hypothetical protein [Alsobacter soli]PSC06555.1 hypothetical protein SLNSH_01710 [Alsobacter soli]